MLGSTQHMESEQAYFKRYFVLCSLQEFRDALRPKFRFKDNKELLWACTDRAKSVAANIKKNKAYFGPQLTGEQVSF